MKGLFVTFDGPSGCGKSTFLSSVERSLSNLGLNCLITKEPTPKFKPTNEEMFNGQKLFAMLLQDRETHIKCDLISALNKGYIILCDRYVASSLVYQRIDGLTLDFIWSKNSHFLVPDLSVLVFASEATLQNRLAQRQSLTRFEKAENRKNELEFYMEAAEYLQAQGYLHIFVENEDRCLDNLVDQVVFSIQGLIHEKTSIA